MSIPAKVSVNWYITEVIADTLPRLELNSIFLGTTIVEPGKSGFSFDHKLEALWALPFGEIIKREKGRCETNNHNLREVQIPAVTQRAQAREKKEIGGESDRQSD